MNNPTQVNRRLKVLTWHVHGNYLYYLTQTDCDFYLPVKSDAPGYGGRSGSFAWGENVFEIPADEVKNHDFDVILFQSKENYLFDQHEILSPTQLLLPKVYVEHDPPREHPTDTKHIVDDPDMLMVHVTHFNNLMWDNNRTPSVVIDHGVMVPEDVHYTGELEKGVVVINNIALRGRRLGYDIFEEVRKEVPLDIIGMGSKEIGGLGEVPAPFLPEIISRYRFYFHPVRYTSLGLSVCEAMMVGLPIVGMATTELTTVIENGINGYVNTNTDVLIGKMNELLSNKEAAESMGEKAKTYAQLRFNIARFTHNWQMVFEFMTSKVEKQVEEIPAEPLVI